MAKPVAYFQQFITRVHRRYVLMHVVEHGVVGLTIGAVMGIALAAILIWRGVETEAVVLATPMLGLLLGVIQGIASRPQRMTAAMIADQQLRLADLLSSALAVSDFSDWAPVIRSQADAVCRKLSPSDVVLHRLGVRVWGGAGLASALLIALAFIPTSAAPSHAQISDDIGPIAGNAELMQSVSRPRPTAVQADPDSLEHSQFGDNAVAAKQNEIPGSAGGSDGQSASGKQAANGTGAASGDLADPSRLKLNAGKVSAAGGHTPGDGTGVESTGVGGAKAAGSFSAAGNPAQSIPPWKSSTWPAQIKQAQSELRAGHIPDAYRDMIGGYFDAH